MNPIPHKVEVKADKSCNNWFCCIGWKCCVKKSGCENDSEGSFISTTESKTVTVYHHHKPKD